MKTFYFAQAFSFQKTGKKGALKLTAEQPTTCASAEEATNKAERLAGRKEGAIAAMQEFDEGSGEYGQFVLLAQYGTIPAEALGEE